MTAVTVRPAEPTDMAAVCRIVNHFIESSAANFATMPRTPQEWTSDLSRFGGLYPWLVACHAESVVGVAYAVPWSDRGAYAWCAEVTVYVAPDRGGEGIGSRLYERLLADLDGADYRSSVAVIALPNPASVSLHESFGFEHAGTLTRVGYKFGTWHDVGLWQRHSGDGDAPPAPIDKRSR